MGITIGGDLTIDTAYEFPAVSVNATTGADQTQPVKQWIDPAPKADIFGNVSYMVLATGPGGKVLAGPNGLPYLVPMTLPASLAMRANIITGPTTSPVLSPLPFPIDVTKIPQGFVLGWSQLMPSIPVLHNANPPAPTETGTLTVGMLNRLDAFLTKQGF